MIEKNNVVLSLKLTQVLKKYGWCKKYSQPEKLKSKKN